MDGILVVDKPSGITSHDVVSRVRRIAGQKRVGHAGTLDPAATGVLIVLLGRATKISDHLSNSDKSYEGVMVFGVETDTFDGDGRVTRETDASGLTERTLKDMAENLKGDIMQVPPAYSAIKVGGKPMYRLAREGKVQPEVESRCVSVYDFEITSFVPGLHAEARFTAECSKGTYIRSMAADLGEATGFGAYLKELRRTKAGSFKLRDAISLDGLTIQNINGATMCLAAGLTDTPSITVEYAGAERVMNGFGLDDSGLDLIPGTRVTILDDNGLVLAVHVANQTGGTKPLKVIGEGRL